MRTARILLISLFICFAVTAVFAQDDGADDLNDEFVPQFDDEDMKPLKVKKGDFSINYGAWITSMAINDNDGNTSLLSSLTLSKLWLRLGLFQNFEIYGRLKDAYFKALDDPDDKLPDSDETNNQLDLDAGYIGFSTESNLIQIYLGRKHYHLGTGLVFSGKGDGGELGLYTSILDIKLFGAHTGFLNKDTNPYRLVGKEFQDEGKRLFLGGTISKTMLNQQIYMMVLQQKDMADYNANNEDMEYNSQYIGGGLKGSFYGAQYYAEYILEQGENYQDDSANPGVKEKSDIDAKAMQIGLNYYFDLPLKPVLLLSYARGTGDTTRTNAKAPNGNSDETDNGFIYFGKFVGGYALRPYLSNIDIRRIGFSVSPLSTMDSRILNRMTIIAKYTMYEKVEEKGDIYTGAGPDPTAQDNKDIGSGIDISFRWKVFYDFSAFINYAVFMPGDAMGSGAENRTFIMGGINLML